MHHLKLQPVIWSEIWRLTRVKKYSGKWHCAGAILTDALKSVITPEIEQKCYSTRRSDVWANRKILLTQRCSFARLLRNG